MAEICPTVLADTPEDFAVQMRRAAGLSRRVQIDLMDGIFAPAKSVRLDEIWWPAHIIADIHLMYQNPFDYLSELIHLQPYMVIIHVETMVHHMHFAAELHKEGIKAGLALLPETPVANVEQILNSFDHMLIFSGDLGKFGGSANTDLVYKAAEAKEHHPDLEIGWDGGVNPDNAGFLARGGVDVLNAGGYLQKSNDPQASFKKLVDSIEI